MPTDEERREVAEDLRYEVDYPYRPIQYMEQFVGDLRQIIFSDFATDADYSEMFSRLADLIDPEPERTCRNVSDNETGFTCSECGASVTGGDYRHSYVDDAGVRWYTTADAPRWNRCPNCGAKVVDK